MRRIGLALYVSGWLATAGCGVYGPPERQLPAAQTPAAAAAEEEVVPTRTLPEEDEFREDSEEHPAAAEPVR